MVQSRRDLYAIMTMDAKTLFEEYEDGRRKVKEYPSFGFRPLLHLKQAKGRTCKSNIRIPPKKLVCDRRMTKTKRNNGGIKKVRCSHRQSQNQHLYFPDLHTHEIEEIKKVVAFIEEPTEIQVERVRVPRTLNVIVDQAPGSTLCLTMTDTSTLTNVKFEIEKRTGTPCKIQRLRHRGRPVKDSERLHVISRGETDVYLLLFEGHLRGGAPPTHTENASQEPKGDNSENDTAGKESTSTKKIATAKGAACAGTQEQNGQVEGSATDGVCPQENPGNVKNDCKRLSNLEFLNERLPSINFTEGANDPNIKKFCLRHIYGRNDQSANELEQKLSFFVLYDTTKITLDDDMRKRVWGEVVQKHTQKWADLLSLDKGEGWSVSKDDNVVYFKEKAVELRLGAGGEVKAERLEDLEKLEDRTVILLVDDSVVKSNMKGNFCTMKRDKGYITYKGRSKTAYHAKLSMTEDGTNVSFGDFTKPMHSRKQSLFPSNSAAIEKTAATEATIPENVPLPMKESSNDQGADVEERKLSDKLCSVLAFLEESLPRASFSLDKQNSETKQFCLKHIFSRKGPKANELERKFIFLMLYDPAKMDLNEDLRKRIWTEVVQRHAVDWTRLLTAEQKRGWTISECDSFICIDGKPVEFELGSTNKNSKSNVRALPLEDVQKKEDCAVVLLVDDSVAECGMKGQFSALKNGEGMVSFEGHSENCYHARVSLSGDMTNVSFCDLLKPLEVAPTLEEASPLVEGLNTCKPRTFKATATESLKYSEVSVFGCRESGDEGNLLTPAHEFKLFTEAVKTEAFIQKFAKEVLKFACACLNSRKNGTIHFGIADEDQQLASRNKFNPCQIIGVPVADKTLYKDKLTNYINNYFDEENRDFARMCICKPEFVKVETSSACATVKYVIEVDIESSYEFTNGKTFMVALPRPSDRKKQKKQYEAFIRNGPQSSTLSDASLDSYTKNMERIDSKRKQEELEIPKRSKNMTWQLRNMLGEDCGRLNSTYKRILVLSAMDTSILKPEFLEKAAVISNIPWSFVIDLNAKDKSEPGLCQSMTDKTEFEIHDAQEFNSDKAKKSAIPTAWVFGNGSGKRSLPKSWDDWQVSDEAKGVQALIQKASSEYPPNRTIILFLIKPGFSKIEVMIYHWFILHFQKNVVCFYIEDEQTEIDWQEYVVKENKYLDHHKFLSQGILGLPLEEFIEEIKNLTVECQSGIIKVPLNKDTLMSMQRGHFNDRSVLLMDSKECSHFHKLHKDDPNKLRKIKMDREKLFYRGQEVSMENLWFTEYGAKQVIKRDVLVDLDLCFRNALSSDPDISQGVETIRILHSRGSGGTTVGKHFLWTLFYRQPPYIARCCIVNIIKEETIDTIYNFWNYKNSSRLPLVVLVDEQQDSDFQTLVKGLSEKMEIRGTGIILLRVEPCSDPETEARQDDWTKCVTLDFRLKEEEQIRFHQKYEEMQTEFGKGFKDYEKTLISFMMMMHRTHGESYHYAERIVRSALTDVSNDERDLLKFLSLINSSVIDEHYRYIYIAAFDPIMSSFNFRKKRFKSDWTSSISMNAKMFLKFKDIPVSNDAYDQPERGVTVIFSEFAEAILTWAKTYERKTIGDVALDLMNSAAFPSTENAPRMNEPLRCLYFNMYLALQNKRKQPTEDEKRELFSRLITKTLSEDTAVFKDNLDKALKLMALGFEKMDRPVLAQQVARLSYIHGSQIDDEREAYFANAERWVQKALSIRKDAYFYDTAGRIRLRKLHVVCPVHGRYQRHHRRYDTDECTKALNLCLESIKWFQEAQRAAQIRKVLNTASYTGEMSAMLYFASILSNSVVFQDYLNSDPGVIGKYFCHPSWKPKRIPWSEEQERTLKTFRSRYLHCLRKVDEVNFILKAEDETENDLIERLDGQFQEFFVYSSRGQLPDDRARWKNNWMFIESLTAGSLLYNIFKPKRMRGKSKRSTSHILSDLSEIQKKIEENLDLDVDDEARFDDVFMLTVVKIASYSPYRKAAKPKEYAIKEFRETKLNTEALLKREERVSGKFKNYCLLFCSMFQWPHPEPRLQTDKNWFKNYNETLEKLRSMSTRLQSDHQKQGSDTGEEFCRRQGLKPHPRYCSVTTQFYLGHGDGLEMYVHHNELHYYIRPQKGLGINWEHPYVERRLQQLSGERINPSYIEYTTADQETLEIEVASHWKERFTLEPVTFYVGFSWKGPLAYGVKVKRQQSHPDTDLENTMDYPSATYEVPRDRSP